MSARASSSSSMSIMKTLRSTRSASAAKRTFSSTPSTSEAPYYNPWRYLRRHTNAAPSVPAPLPRLYPQRVVLSDGSTFTSYTTAPTPSIARMTRDVTNNPLWAPGTERRGLEDQEGRVGKFRRKFEGMDLLQREDAGGELLGPDAGEVVDDLSWMSEGGREEIAPPPKIKRSAGGKGGKKK